MAITFRKWYGKPAVDCTAARLVLRTLLVLLVMTRMLKPANDLRYHDDQTLRHRDNAVLFWLNHGYHALRQLHRFPERTVLRTGSDNYNYDHSLLLLRTMGYRRLARAVSPGLRASLNPGLQANSLALGSTRSHKGTRTQLAVCLNRTVGTTQRTSTFWHSSRWLELSSMTWKESTRTP